MDDRLLEVRARFLKEFDEIIIEDTMLIIEESFEGECKNDDDCYDHAQENGHRVQEIFPELELISYYCHRHKYAITELKFKEYEK